MHPNLQEASEHIRTYLANGVPEMHIREHYVNHGWSNEWFEEALAHAKASMPSPTDTHAAPQADGPVTPSENAATEQTVAATDAPRKYRVFRAIKDYFDAVKNRPKQYFGAAGIGILTYFVSLIPLGLFVALLVLLKPHGIILGALILLAILLFIIWYAFATTFFMVITSWVLAPGLTTPNEPIPAIVRNALNRTTRAALTVAGATALTFLPLLVTVFILLMVVFAALSGNSNPGAILALTSLLMLVSFVWILIASLRLALVQQVAVFEPGLSMLQTFKRSSFLLKSGGFVNNGQWFLLKGLLLLLAINIVLSLFTHASLTELQKTDNIFLNLVLAVISIVSQGVLAMLYFNRSAVFPKTAS